jgi:hypothetical protein
MFTARDRRRVTRNPAAILATIVRGRVGIVIVSQCAVQIVPSLKRNSSRGAPISHDVWHRRPLGKEALGLTSVVCPEPIAFPAGNRTLIRSRWRHLRRSQVSQHDRSQQLGFRTDGQSHRQRPSADTPSSRASPVIDMRYS